MKSQKITKVRQAVEKRRYDDACAATHAIDILGDRWALPVMRELMLGPCRFGDLRRSLPAISANVLTQRLHSLEAAGVLIRRKLAPPANVQVYELTRWGYEAQPIFQALGLWGVKSPAHDPTKPFSATSLALSLRTMIDPSKAAGMTASVGFAIDHQEFEVRVTDGITELLRSDPDEPPDARFAGSAQSIAAAIYAKVPLADLEAAATLVVSGDRNLARRFVDLYTLPEKAAAAD